MKPTKYKLDNDIKIEKGIPLPARLNSTNRFPFKDMEIGDSFETDFNSIVAYASRAGKTLNMRFIARKQDNGRWRVWRSL